MEILSGKVALVTGTNRGIGKAIVEKFAEQGAVVFAHARNENIEFEQYCKDISEKYNTEVEVVYFDVLDDETMKKSIMDIKKKKGSIDILVNNVGTVGSVSLYPMTSIEQMKETFEVNFFAQMRLSQYVSRFMMRSKKGSIVNISSCAGLDGDTGMIDYVSSKAAMIGATKRMAIELGEYGIRVNSVAPSLTDTDMGNRMSEELTKETLSKSIMKRMGKPEEIANVVLFLASEMASFMTGQVIRVDGGMLR